MNVFKLSRHSLVNFINRRLTARLRSLRVLLALALAPLPLIPAAVAAETREATVPTLREGDRVLTTTLVDENGETIHLAHPERPTVMTFIFTRCAAMEFCPKMNSQFNALQEQIQEGSLGNPRLVSITLDPAYDRPERLKEYGAAIGADPAFWNFATGSKEEIDRITKAFRVYRETAGGVLNHSLCTALIAPDGKITKIWRGNAWKPEEVLTELMKSAATR